jgi:3-methyl-2-oxobutanoate hydroxymethyltransferase
MFTDFTPKFVKRYADLGSEMQRAAAAFADDVRNRRFPEAAQCFGVKAPAAAE